MLVIGITGGVGCGKSTVLDSIRDRYNCIIYKADDEANRMKKQGERCYQELVALMGEDILSLQGDIDNKKMAATMFADSSLVEKVNGIIHPAVKEDILTRIKEAESEGKADYFFIEAALLIECGYGSIVDSMWYISADSEVRAKRLRESRGYSDEKIAGIMRSQLKDDEFRASSDIIIDNNSEMSETMRQIDDALKRAEKRSKMVKIIMHGCNGRMGQMITGLVEQDDTVEIVAGVDKFGGSKNGYPVFEDIKDCDIQADAVIDFSNAAAVDGLLDYCMEHKLPCVLCSTGLSEEQIARVNEASDKVAICRSANMSLGINLLMKLLKEAAPVLAEAGFDIEIVEKHHNQKLDAPSGTALALADSINEVFDEPYEYVYDRSTRRQKRDAKELGISAVRGGTIVGDHDVIFAGSDEVITFSHSAYSRGVFGKGAIQAAKFLKGKEKGMYDMSDVIG
ncbi:MAG: 4-hydroxy-tetrahydrodipicolinate reductase [Lachnospiraceae bacterium]|nr:4-hydroxy-tetrahydrodipicolinate reductase [Lachnospiraceae bacterium]